MAATAFVAVTYPLGAVCFALSPVALAIVFWYSLAKRHTTWTQLFLGLALAVAPVGGWLAAGGGLELDAVAAGGGHRGLGRRLRHDLRLRGCRLRSPPTDSDPFRPGSGWSGRCVSRASRTSWTVAGLAALAWLAPLGPVYLAGVAGVALLLAYEQSLVSAADLSRVKQAFDLNGYVGILYLATTAAAIHVG